MKARARAWLLASCAAATASSISAQGTSCPDPQTLGNPVMDGRQETLDRYREVPQQCLEAMFIRCEAEANTRIIEFGDAATCSVTYEALLDRGFGGSMKALLAWWHSQPVRVARTEPVSQ